jgi:hypothetical protein
MDRPDMLETAEPIGEGAVVTEEYAAANMIGR